MQLATLVDDVVTEGRMDEVAELAATRCDAPIGLVTLVDADLQRFAGVHGLVGDDGSPRRATQLALSLCAEVRRANDARSWTNLPASALADHGAVTELGIKSYLGLPLRGRDGRPLGAACVADRAPRTWSIDDRVAVATAVVLAERELRRHGW